MRGIGQSYRGVILVLFLIAILTPGTLETETFGAGEVMILDGVFVQSKFGCVCWVIEWNSTRALTPTLDTFELLFPYVNTVTILVSIIGILSPIASWLVLTNRFSFQKGLLIIVLSTLLIVLAPEINILRVERVYTYQMRPLLVPQIVNSFVLFWHQRNRNHEIAK